jgi:CubicO group peptidase (beta-lactamase class C family)
VSEHPRLAVLEDAPGTEEMMASMPKDLPMFKAAPPALYPNAAFGGRADILAADIPAGTKTSARATARMYAAMLDEVDGVRLLSPQRLREVSAVAIRGVDEVFGMPSSWALGYSAGRPGAATAPDPNADMQTTAFGMGGTGGSYGYADTATGIAFALTKNRLTFDLTAATEISRIVVEAIAGDAR